MASLQRGAVRSLGEVPAPGDRDEMTRVADLPLTRGDLEHREGTLVPVAAYL
jgi:hypothetical protein